MRIVFLSLLLGMAITAAAQQEPMYVAAKSGLSIREKPEIGAKVLDKIPYGKKITLLNDEEEKKSIVTEGMTGYWSKVKYKNSTGYVVDSYLLPWTPPKLATVKTMKQYIAQIAQPFGSRLVVKSGNMTTIEGTGAQIGKQLYKNGAEWHEFQGYEYASDAYFLPGFTTQQGFLLLRLISEFADVFGEKDEFPVSSKTLKRGEKEIKYKIEKETWGEEVEYNWIKRINAEYEDNGPAYFFEMYQLDNQLVVFFGSGV